MRIFLYYTWAVEPTILTALNKISAQQPALVMPGAKSWIAGHFYVESSPNQYN